MEIVGREHVVGHVALVYIHMRPLSALSLMTCHGISIFHLEGIEIDILPDAKALSIVAPPTGSVD